MTQTLEFKQDNMLAYLKMFKVFAGLSQDALDEIIKKVTLRYYGKDYLLLLEGDSWKNVYGIIKGKVKVFSSTRLSRDLIFDILMPGDTIGEFVPFTKWKAVSLRTTEDTIILGILMEDFNDFLNIYPILLRNTTQKVVDLFMFTSRRFMCQTIEQRIALVVSEFTARYGSKVSLTHQDIAELANTTRANGSVILKRMEKYGIIAHRRNEIELLDRNKLNNYFIDPNHYMSIPL